MDHKEIECEGVVKLMVQWGVVVSTIINHANHKNEKSLLASKEPSSMATDIIQLASFIIRLKRLRREVNTDILSCVCCWSQPQCGFPLIDNGCETPRYRTGLLYHNLTAELGNMCWQSNNNLNLYHHLLIAHAA